MDAARQQLIKGRRIELERRKRSSGGNRVTSRFKWEQEFLCRHRAVAGICRVLSIPAAALLGIEVAGDGGLDQV